MVTVAGIVVALHGLTHLWYVVLSQRLLAFRPEMGWTGTSWLLTGALGEPTARTVASVVYALASVAFVIAAIAVVTQAPAARPLLLWAALLSLTAIVVFWDGRADHLVEKGAIGLLIDVAVLASLRLT